MLQSSKSKLVSLPIDLAYLPGRDGLLGFRLRTAFSDHADLFSHLNSLGFELPPLNLANEGGEFCIEKRDVKGVSEAALFFEYDDDNMLSLIGVGFGVGSCQTLELAENAALVARNFCIEQLGQPSFSLDRLAGWLVAGGYLRRGTEGYNATWVPSLDVSNAPGEVYDADTYADLCQGVKSDALTLTITASRIDEMPICATIIMRSTRRYSPY